MLKGSSPDFPRVSTRRQIIGCLALTGSGFLTGCAAPPPTYATGLAAQREAALPADAPTLIYASSDACSACMVFRQYDFRVFEDSKERQGIRVVLLHSLTVSISTSGNSEWTGGYQWALDAARDHSLLMATPLFILTKQQQYLIAGYGRGDWQNDILPAIRRETGLA
jgi:hypothetical protein